MSNVDIARELSLTAFLERELGMQGKRIGKHVRFNYCPVCTNEGSQPNKLKISLTDKSYNCFRCGCSGDVIEAAMNLWGVPFMDAVDKLAGNFSSGVKRSPVNVDKIQKEDVERNQKIAEVIKKLKPVFKNNADDFKCIQYLTQERKLPIELVKQAQARGMLGFMPGNSNKAGSQIIEAVGETLLRDVGMWKEGAKIPSISYKPIVFLLPGETSAEFRMIGSPEDGYPKSFRYGTNIKYPFVWKSKMKSTKGMVVEGFIDMLSAVALGYKGNVIGLPGCENWRIDWFKGLKGALALDEFILALDNDASASDDPPEKLNPGQKGQKALREALIAENINFSEKILPPASDINSILQAKTAA